eukprot:m.62284 g.62284  ORF g.62284 m.62284 type:complete len:180 (+) comp9609_c0_seq1:253-792(+)
MLSAVSVVQLLATVTTFVLFSSGLPMIRKIAADKDAGAVSPIPWLTQVVNGLMWLKYGLLVGDKMIIGVNLTGAISGLYYSKVYGDHTSGAGFGRAVARAAAAAYTPLLIIQLMPSYESAVLFMGYVSSLLSVLLFGSPLVNAVGATLATSRFLHPYSLASLFKMSLCNPLLTLSSSLA